MDSTGTNLVKCYYIDHLAYAAFKLQGGRGWGGGGGGGGGQMPHAICANYASICNAAGVVGGQLPPLLPSPLFFVRYRNKCHCV